MMSSRGAWRRARARGREDNRRGKVGAARAHKVHPHLHEHLREGALDEEGHVRFHVIHVDAPWGQRERGAAAAAAW